MRALTIAAVVLFSLDARGEVKIVYTTGWPDEEIIYGCPITFSLDGLTERTSSITWEYKGIGDCETEYGPTSTTNHGTEEWGYEIIPGSFRMRCRIVYDRRSDGTTPDPEAPTLDYTVPPPDGTEIVQGDGRIYRVGMDIPVVLVITCKGKWVCTAWGLAQERIPVWLFLGAPTRPHLDWGPPFPTPRFFRSNNAIVDLKLMRETEVWPRIPLGTFFDQVQEFQIVIPDLCGNPKPHFLDTYDVKWVKTDDISYKVVHTKRKK